MNYKLTTKALWQLLLIILILSPLHLGATKHSPALEKALYLADMNRASLELVLKHYANDKEKYQAACFLIENMVGYSQSLKVNYYDPHVDVFRNRVDSVFYSMVKGKTSEETASADFKKQLTEAENFYRLRIENYPYRKPEVTTTNLPDIQTLDANFLIHHIDNAFEKRKTVKFARELSFADFCRYVLPYRVIGDNPLVQESKSFTDVFSKYIQAEKVTTVNEAVERYNRISSHLRWFMGKYPFQSRIGFNEMFYNNFIDCVDVAHYGASVLRACGIPAVVEYNMAYKIWSGRHYHVSTLDSARRWCTFSPEGNLPKYRDQKFREALNIYRLHFDKQKNNPSYLKGKEEKIPSNLSDPYIEDVTTNIMAVATLQLPFKEVTANKLAYLVSFQSQIGLIPVTWGKIDTQKKTVSFETVVPDNLYFPMFVSSDNKLKAFGNPFWIKTDSTNQSFKVIPFDPQPGKTLSVDLLRKFPRKPNMVRVSETLKGAVVIASNNALFTNADTLASISSTPEPYWQELELKNTNAYRFYRIQNKDSTLDIALSELEFLTNKKYNYGNTIEATSLPLLSANQAQVVDTNIVRILDEPYEKYKNKAEYDGNVLTSPTGTSFITFHLSWPQVVTAIRFVPKNEDNGIQPGNKYSLSVWNGYEWEILFTTVAKFQYLRADNLQVGKLYWLRNITRGREELPFTIDENGKQQFIHDDLLRILKE